MSTFMRVFEGHPVHGVFWEEAAGPAPTIPTIRHIAPGAAPSDAGVYLHQHSITVGRKHYDLFVHHPAGLRDGRPA